MSMWRGVCVHASALTDHSHQIRHGPEEARVPSLVLSQHRAKHQRLVRDSSVPSTCADVRSVDVPDLPVGASDAE